MKFIKGVGKFKEFKNLLVRLIPTGQNHPTDHFHGGGGGGRRRGLRYLTYVIENHVFFLNFKVYTNFLKKESWCAWSIESYRLFVADWNIHKWFLNWQGTISNCQYNKLYYLIKNRFSISRWFFSELFRYIIKSNALSKFFVRIC